LVLRAAPNDSFYRRPFRSFDDRPAGKPPSYLCRPRLGLLATEFRSFADQTSVIRRPAPASHLNDFNGLDGIFSSVTQLTISNSFNSSGFLKFKRDKGSKRIACANCLARLGRGSAC
jgi:hypothetical protein